MKLKERITSEISPAQFPRKLSTAKSTSLLKGANECVPRTPKWSVLSYKSINDSAPCTPKLQECALGRRRGSSAHGGTRLNQQWHKPEDIKILLPVEGAGQQDFKGLLWSQRIWQPRPISYQAQGPRWGGRNVRGSTKRASVARKHRRGQSCPRPTKIVRKRSDTPLKTTSLGVLSKKD